MTPNPRLLPITVILIFILALVGCAGGGTSGTGLEVVDGTVNLTTLSPLSDANVTVIETGDSGMTDQTGHFHIGLSGTTDVITLLVEKDELQVRVAVNGLPGEAEVVSVLVLINSADQSGQATVIDYSGVREFRLAASVVGRCDLYFENHPERIRQANPVAPGTQCTLKASVQADGIDAGGVLVGLERRACAEGSPWRLVTAARTVTGPNQGTVQIPFNFYDSERACFYRVSAPLKDEQQRERHLQLVTLTGQEYEAKSKQ